MARGGEDVTLCDSVAEHVDAMKGAGLRIEAFNGTFTVPVRALHPMELTGPLEVVLLCVKAQHTATAVRSILPVLGPGSTIVSIQNGLCETVIADLVGHDRTLGAFVNFGAQYLGPGSVRFAGRGSLYLGELDGRITPRLREIANATSKWDTTNLTDNINGYLWAKLAFLQSSIMNALVDESNWQVIDRNRELYVELACEVCEVAAKEGVRLESFEQVRPDLYYPREKQHWAAINRSIDELVARYRGEGSGHSGPWRDINIRKRKTEVAYLSGKAIEIGARHGLKLPLTRQLVRMIHEREDGTRPSSWANLQELNDSLRVARVTRES